MPNCGVYSEVDVNSYLEETNNEENLEKEEMDGHM